MDTLNNMLVSTASSGSHTSDMSAACMSTLAPPQAANNTLSHTNATSANTFPNLPDMVTQGDFVGGTGAAALPATSKKPKPTKMRPGTTTTARYVQLKMKFID